jgi:hypothetical protein
MPVNEHGTQFFTVNVERYTLDGMFTNGRITECDICEVSFESSVFDDPEYHKGCDLQLEVAHDTQITATDPSRDL